MKKETNISGNWSFVLITFVGLEMS